jgi:hypothetical protein
MKSVDCEFESEVLAAVVQSRWPDRVDASLRAHASTCAICSDVAAVAAAIGEASDEMRASVAVPDSGGVWWRARLRARREAAEAAGRPITAAQVIALACAAGLLGACFGATSSLFQSAILRIASVLTAFDWKALVSFAVASLAAHGALAAGIAALLLLAPAAAYLIAKD